MFPLYMPFLSRSDVGSAVSCTPTAPLPIPRIFLTHTLALSVAIRGDTV